ncbi:MAG TPA: hypothetical protein VGD80_07255 [Kofleriaceae bacterium]
MVAHVMSVGPIKCRAAPRERIACDRNRDGTPGAQPRGMSAKSKRSSEAWTIPLHVIMWATITIGFIMTLVVLMMRR